MLTQSELILLESRLGRKPSQTELAVFDAMWSEHCSYKSSRAYLKKLALTEADLDRKISRREMISKVNFSNILAGQGENAGVLNIGEDHKLGFKMESHNHPSYIEPFQGAATGVGGILRDIFTMGLRPIALTNNLFFADPAKSCDAKRVQDGVIAGLTHYGNCVGVPTVQSKILYNDRYEKNPLVNAMAIGHTCGKIYTSKPRRNGKIYYVGAKTGRDGIGGAVMASDAFTENQNLRPTVQVGDPYLEKLLIEACLELFETGSVIAAQDMGAAGLTSTTTELAIKGQKGIDIDLDKVPLREEGMEAWEILLSESQERMLFVIDPNINKDVFAIFDKWDLECVEIGTLTDSHKFIVYKDGKQVCDFPLNIMDYPELIRPTSRPAKRVELNYSVPLDMSPIWQQFDSQVGGNTVKGLDSDVAIVELPFPRNDMYIAIATDSYPYHSYTNPANGIKFCISSIYDRLLGFGAQPLAMTNCLNFGNPENPEIMWEFVETVEAMSYISELLDFPVVSGNVSFYNETSGQNIMPTPVIGGIGIISK